MFNFLVLEPFFLVNKTMITFFTRDGLQMQTVKHIWLPSTIIQNMVDEDEDEIEIPLPLVTHAQLQHIVRFLTMHAEQPCGQPSKPLASANLRENGVQPMFASWVESLPVTQNGSGVVGVLGAAHYLDIDPLVKLLAARLAASIRGLTPEEIRNLLGLQDDLTPAEKSRHARENQWCLDL
jgi:S-phase kinase-associated protein 1